MDDVDAGAVMPLQRLLNRIGWAESLATETAEPAERKGDYARLEERIAYSASPMGDLDVDALPADAPDDVSWTDADAEAGIPLTGDESLQGLDDIAATEFAEMLELGEFDAELLDLAEDQSSPSEIVIVDSTVDAYEQLVADIVGRSESADVAVLVLTPDEDGIAQITAALEQVDQLQAVHVVSHGDEGRVRLGRTVLDINTLPAHVASIAAWGDALTSDGDILFYGCDLAGSADGVELLESVAALTSADVAASDDATGHDELGADWRLEHSVGVVDTGIVFSQAVQEGWLHTLAFTATPETLVNQDPTLPTGETETTEISGATGQGVDSAIGVAADGSYVVVWTGHSGNSTADVDAYFQRFDASGNSVGNAVRVNETIAGEQDDVSVAVRPDGSFVVVWEGDEIVSGGGVHDTYMRLYDANGNAITGEIIVNDDRSGHEGEPTIAMNDSGQFVVAWRLHPSQIYAQTFDADGNPISSNFLVNGGSSNGRVASVGIDGAGNSVIAWSHPGTGVSYARFDVNGNQLTTEVLLPALPGGDDGEEVSVDVREDGFVAMTVGGGNPDSSGGQLVRILDSNLNLVASRFFAGEYGGTTVLFSDDDRLVLVSEGEGVNDATTDDDGIVAKVLRLDGSDIEVEDEFLVNSTSAGGQIYPSVAGLDADNFAVVWSGNGVGDDDGVFVRTFAFEAPPEPPVLADQLAFVVENDADFSASVVAADPDGELVSFEILSGDPLGVFEIDNDGVITVANTTLLDFEIATSYSLTVRVTDSSGLSDTGVVTIGVVDMAEASLSGTIWHDINGDASISEGHGIDNTSVLLYRDNGDGVAGDGDLLVRQTTTDADGRYQFSGLAEGTYWTVVDSKSISVPLNSGFTSGDVWAEQTYGVTGALIDTRAGVTVQRSNNGAAYGGRNADVSDDASSLQTSEHVTETTIQQADVNDVDFGFSFNVVVNVSGEGDQDDDPAADRTMQGTLRQFVGNANAIEGANRMRFVPVLAANESAGPSEWWSIGLTSGLSNLRDANTTIDGRAFDLDGGGELDSNIDGTGATVSVGTGADGWVGDGSNDETVLASAPRPELEIYADGLLTRGFSLMGDDITVSNVALHGFTQASIQAGANVVEVLNPVVDNVISGGRANVDFDDISTMPGSGGFGIKFKSADGGTISNSVIVRSSLTGVTTYDSSSINIVQNRIVFNGIDDGFLDGVDIVSGAEHNISGNYIVGNRGSGIDTYSSTGGHIIQGNTVSGNGLSGDEVAGIRLFGDGSTVTLNVIEGNVGDGVLVVGEAQQIGTSAATNNRITRNRFIANGQQAIDLGVRDGDRIHGDGIDSIDGLDATSGNRGIDRIDLAVALQSDNTVQLGVEAASLTVGSTIELYAASPEDPSDMQGGVSFGEGANYIGQFFWDGTTATATDVSGYTVRADDGFTAIVIDPDGNTSEFSAVQMLTTNQPPVATDDRFVIWENQPLAGDVRGNDFDPDGDPGLIYELVAGTEPSAGILDFRADGTFDYLPDENASGAVQFDYIVTDSTGAVDRATVQIVIRDDQRLEATGPFVVAEGAASVITRDTLLTVDSDTANDELVYAIETATQSGHLEFLDSPGDILSVGDTFTQADIDAGRLVYVHDSSDVQSDAFRFTVDDDGGVATQGTMEIVIVNAEESIAINETLRVTEGSETLITRESLATLDADDPDDEIVYTVTTDPLEGRLQLAGAGAAPVTTFTQQDINDGRLSYVHAGQTQATDAFDFTVDDGQGTVSSGQFRFGIELINAPPQIDTPAMMLVGQGTDVVFSSADGNSIIIEDVDAGGQVIEVTLQVPDGDITFAATDGLTFLTGDGDADSEVVVRGTLEDINAALDGIRIQYAPDFFGFSSLEITVNDLGNVGQPGPLIANATTEIEVREAVSASDDSFVVMRPTELDVKANDSFQDGFALVEAPANGNVTITASGDFVYVPDSGFVGVDTFQYSISDGLTSDVATVEILVSAPPPPTATPSDSADDGDGDSDSESEDSDDSSDDSSESLLIAGAGSVGRTSEGKAVQAQTQAIREGGAELTATVSPTRSATEIVASAEDEEARRYENRRQSQQTQNYDFVTGTFNVASEFVATTFDSVSLLGGLDHVEDAMMHAVAAGSWQVHSGMALTSGLSIGWVLWSTKGSYIVGSLLSTASPWMFVDPLPVLDAIDKPKRSRRKDKSGEPPAEQNTDKLESMID